MRPIHAPTNQPRLRSTAAVVLLRAGVESWLEAHPEVPWSVDQMLKRVEQVGQAKAGIDALRAAGALKRDLV